MPTEYAPNDVLEAFASFEPEDYITLIVTRHDYLLEITLDNNGPIQKVSVHFPINGIVKDTAHDAAGFIAQTAQTMIENMVALRSVHDHPEIFMEDDDANAA